MARARGWLLAIGFLGLFSAAALRPAESSSESADGAGRVVEAATSADAYTADTSSPERQPPFAVQLLVLGSALILCLVGVVMTAQALWGLLHPPKLPPRE